MHAYTPATNPTYHPLDTRTLYTSSLTTSSLSSSRHKKSSDSLHAWLRSFDPETARPYADPLYLFESYDPFSVSGYGVRDGGVQRSEERYGGVGYDEDRRRWGVVYGEDAYGEVPVYYAHTEISIGNGCGTSGPLMLGRGEWVEDSYEGGAATCTGVGAAGMKGNCVESEPGTSEREVAFAERVMRGRSPRPTPKGEKRGKRTGWKKIVRAVRGLFG